MSVSSTRVLIPIAAFLVVGFGVALGQEGEADEAPVEEVGVQQRANLTPADQLEQGHQIQQRGGDLSRRVSTMLDEARQERDIIRVTCLNDKLTQVNANLRTVEQRLENLQHAVDANDAGRRNHEFTVMIVLQQKFVVLDRESSQCIGQDLYDTGSTQVVTEIDPDNPDEDPTILLEPTVPIVPFVPPPVSADM